MTTDSIAPNAGKPAQLSAPRLRPATFEDYPQIQQLESSHLESALPANEWRGLFLDNPLWPRLGDQWPIGWVLEDAAGQVVGSLASITSLYRFRGQDLICTSGRSWVASPEYRAFAPWLLEEFFNQPEVDLCVSNTANEKAEPIFRTFANRIPVGDWESIAYCITGYRGFARKALQKLGIPLVPLLAIPVATGLWLRDALFAKSLPAIASGIAISHVDGFDASFDVFWEDLVRQNPDKLLAARDSRTLAWHYAIPMRRKRLWVLTAVRNGLLRAFCVLNRQDWREGVRRMRVIDYQTVEPEADLLPALLRAAQRRCAAEDYYVFEHLGCGLPKMRVFDDFAPYRRKLPSWPFYYQAADPALAAELQRPEIWDPSTFDGDASLD